jgi:hypothetical protein
VVKLCGLSKKTGKAVWTIYRLYGSRQLAMENTVIIDATLQCRLSLKTKNVKQFNHGKGFAVGHQWSNIRRDKGMSFVIPLWI